MSHASENGRGSISVMISGLRAMNEQATHGVWKFFLKRTQRLASRLLYQGTRRAYDENDAAQSALYAVFGALNDGKYPDVENRESLWALIASITSRKVAQRNRFELQKCRDQRRSVPLETHQQPLVQNPRSLTDSPAMIAELEDTRSFLIAQLQDPDLCQIAELKLQGYNIAEISSRLDLSRRTVDRRLSIIRSRWQRCVSEQLTLN